MINAVQKEIKTKSPEFARSMAGFALLARPAARRDAVSDYRKAIAWANGIFGSQPVEAGPEAANPAPSIPHPDVARFTHVLGQLYMNQGMTSADADQALSCFKQALEIREARLQPNHPDIASLLEDYAAVLHKKGDEKEAATLDKRAAQIRLHINTEDDKAKNDKDDDSHEN